MAKIRINSFTIKGYKSIRELNNFQAKPINILLGANGAGKSNLISFFIFLGKMLHSDGGLRTQVAYLGGANDILFDGADVTQTIEFNLDLETEKGNSEYEFVLRFVKPDDFAFEKERYRFSDKSYAERAGWSNCGSEGQKEPKLPLTNNTTAITILSLLRELVVYQFHNTRDTAPLRLKCPTADGRYLKPLGENLGAFLFNMQQNDKTYYYRIVNFIRTILPFFDDFDLYDEFGSVLLRWKEKGSKKVFNVGQASDGMLRSIALVALLGQNPSNLPNVIFLDEPELGLHPKAINLLAGLIKAASEYSQLFVATQSVALVNNFELDDTVIINRIGRESVFERPNAELLNEYAEEYPTGIIWEKNIIGGRP